jgi:LL-diaminopimelate aminotransferase
MRAKYIKRRDKVLSTLEKIGLSYFYPQATIYVWVEVPEGETSASFTQTLLDRADVVVSPGSAYGKFGEGYVRISLTVPDSLLDEALERIEKVF